MRVHKRSSIRQILTLELENCEKPAVKHSIEKPILLNFVTLSKILCPTLSEEIHFHFHLDPDHLNLYFLKISAFQKTH